MILSLTIVQPPCVELPAIDNCTNSAPRSEPKIQIRGEDIANTPIFLRSLKAEIIASDFDSES